jgi:hypothetical protein
MNTLPDDKLRSRISAILLHASGRFLPSIGNLLLSVLVVRLFAPGWWGQIAALQLYQYIAVQVLAWGNRDMLLRSFSTDPASIPFAFASSWMNRSWLLLPVCTGLFFCSSDHASCCYLIVWIICRFIQESVETPVLFLRRFFALIIPESVAILLVASGLIISAGTSFSMVLLIITLGQLVKTIMMMLFFLPLFRHVRIGFPSVSFFISSLPFMLLGVLAVLQQKTDLWFVVRYTDDILTAQYQVFTTFYLLSLSIPALIAGPFIRNIYRIPSPVFRKVERQFVLAGIVISMLVTAGSYACMEYVYHFSFDPLMYVLSCGGGALTYLFTLKVIRLYRSGLQWKVLMISLIAVLLNAACCIMLLPVMGLPGALTANVLAQLCQLLLLGFNSRSIQAE